MRIKVKHFSATTANAGEAMIAVKSRDLIREVIPNADIMSLPLPVTQENVELFGVPDIIVLGGGATFASWALADFPSTLDLPVYLLGIGAKVEEHRSEQHQRRLDKFASISKNIRLASTREYATSKRLEQFGIKSRVIGCPVMHLARGTGWARNDISHRDRETLVFAYRDIYIPERLYLNEAKALDIAKKLGFNNAIIVAQSYVKEMAPLYPLDRPVTGLQRQTLKIFTALRITARAVINIPPFKKYIHPMIGNELDTSTIKYTIRPGMKFYEPYAYPLIYQNARLLISSHIHASLMAAAVGTPFLHVFIEESNRCRDMIETYDPDLDLHIAANASNFEDIITKARSILENPDPLANYNKRVNQAFAQWELFKEEMRRDLKRLGLQVQQIQEK